MGYPDGKSTEAASHSELVLFRQWPWFSPGEPHPNKMGELVSKRRIFPTLVNSGWGAGLTGGTCALGDEELREGLGSSLPPHDMLVSLSLLSPAFCPSWVSNERFSGFRFCLPGARAAPGWMQRDTEWFLTASSASWILWGRRTAAHPFLTGSGCNYIALLSNTLSSFVRDFLPRSKHLWISWLQSLSSVILEPKENKICHSFHCFPIYLPWSDKTRCHDLHFLNAEF